MTDPLFDFVFDLIEHEDHLFLEVALPGVLETEIDVTLETTRIIIRAERPVARGSTIHREIKRGVLTRDVPLPFAVELVKSRYEDGILWLQFKRLEAP